MVKVKSKAKSDIKGGKSEATGIYGAIGAAKFGPEDVAEWVEINGIRIEKGSTFWIVSSPNGPQLNVSSPHSLSPSQKPPVVWGGPGSFSLKGTTIEEQSHYDSGSTWPSSVGILRTGFGYPLSGVLDIFNGAFEGASGVYFIDLESSRPLFAYPGFIYGCWFEGRVFSNCAGSFLLDESLISSRIFVGESFADPRRTRDEAARLVSVGIEFVASRPDARILVRLPGVRNFVTEEISSDVHKLLPKAFDLRPKSNSSPASLMIAPRPLSAACKLVLPSEKVEFFAAGRRLASRAEAALLGLGRPAEASFRLAGETIRRVVFVFRLGEDSVGLALLASTIAPCVDQIESAWLTFLNSVDVPMPQQSDPRLPPPFARPRIRPGLFGAKAARLRPTKPN